MEVMRRSVSVGLVSEFLPTGRLAVKRTGGRALAGDVKIDEDTLSHQNFVRIPLQVTTLSETHLIVLHGEFEGFYGLSGCM